MAKKTKKQSKNAYEKHRNAEPIGPLKQPALKGMPRIRNAKLDKYAESIGECRDAINSASVNEKHYRAAALKEMQAKAIQFWSHGGVDFIRVPGEDKLKVKTHKDGGSPETGGEEESPEESSGNEVVAMDVEPGPSVADEETPF